MVRMGLIGAGGWGAMHARTYAGHATAELVAVADSDLARAEKLAHLHGARAYADYREMLEQADVDAVAVVTPDFAHDAPILAAIAANKHVLAEKPLAMTVEACERIVHAAEEKGVTVMVDFHARWSPPVYKAWEAVRAGEVGAPKHVYYRLNDRIFVPTQMLSWAGKTTVLWFVGSHAIDTVRWLVGDEVARVYAVSRRGTLSAMGIDTPDFYVSTLEFRSGAVAVIENSWILPNSTPNIVDVKCEIIGEHGSLYIDQSHNRALEKYTSESGSFPDVFVMPAIYGEQMGFAAESIRHFVDCVASGTVPRVTARDGLTVTRIICAIEESIRRRAPVDLP